MLTPQNGTWFGEELNLSVLHPVRLFAWIKRNPAYADKIPMGFGARWPPACR